MRTTIIAIMSLLLALVLWGVFAYLVLTLPRERAQYVEALTVSSQEAVRAESASRVKAIIQDTEVERAALLSLLQVPLIDAIKIVEDAARAAGVRTVTIGEATPVAAKSPSPAAPPTTRVAIVVQAEGTFPALVRTVSLLETLSIPSMLDGFDMEETKDGWRLTARLTLAVAHIQ